MSIARPYLSRNKTDTMIINLSIDVTKIDKNKLIKGAKGTYLNLTVSVNEEADQFGNDCSAWQTQSKEEREAKSQRLFLGNGKVVFGKQKKETVANVEVINNSSDDLPF